MSNPHRAACVVFQQLETLRTKFVTPCSRIRYWSPTWFWVKCLTASDLSKVNKLETCNDWVLYTYVTSFFAHISKRPSPLTIHPSLSICLFPPGFSWNVRQSSKSLVAFTSKINGTKQIGYLLMLLLHKGLWQWVMLLRFSRSSGHGSRWWPFLRNL